MLRDLDTRASARIKHLCDQATDMVLRNATDPTRFEKAEGYLVNARRLAEVFRLDAATIEQRSQWIQQVANQSRLDPTSPMPNLRSAQAPTMPPASEMSEPGARNAAEKLEQARRELRAGDLTMARNLAVDAYAAADKGVAPQVLEEAAKVLRSIDVEEHAQTILTARRNYMAAMEAYRDKDFRRSATLLAAVDVRLLPADQARRIEEIMATPEMQGKTSTAAPGIVPVAANEKPVAPSSPSASSIAMGRTTVGRPGRRSADRQGQGDAEDPVREVPPEEAVGGVHRRSAGQGGQQRRRLSTRSRPA